MAADCKVEEGEFFSSSAFFAKKLPKNRTRIPAEIQRSATASPTPKVGAKAAKTFRPKCPASKGSILPWFPPKKSPATPGSYPHVFLAELPAR